MSPRASDSYNLAISYPELAKEWHPSKNKPLTPKDVTPRSGKMVWWICSEGHEWRTRIANRTLGHNCPYCWGRYPTKENNLIIKHPEIAKEWHPTKNNDITPSDVTPGSGKKVWWKCSEGHEWQATVSRRTSQGSGCPYCAGKHPTKENNLLITYPQIAKEWHPAKNKEHKPDQVTPKSHKKVWWICSEGHEWYTSVATRTRGRGCPECSKNQRVDTYKKSVLKRSGSLAEKFPEIAKEWHPTKNGELTPDQVSPGSHEKVWWICSRGHAYEATILNRTYGTECPRCNAKTSRLEIRIYSELKTIFSDVKWKEKLNGIECDIYIPKYRLALEIDGYPWHEGKEKLDKLKTKRLQSMGVKVFHLRDIHIKRIALTDVFYKDREEHISIIKKVLLNLQDHHSLSPEEKMKISKYIDSNQIMNSVEYNRILSYLPGPPAEISLTQTHPDIAEEWHYEKNSPLKPSMFSYGSGKRVWWRCKKGHEWEQSINQRTASARGCPYCLGRRTSKEYNLAFRFPVVAQEWHPTKNGSLTAFDVTPRSKKKVWWQCNKGHEWQATIQNRVVRGSGCPECYNENRGDIYRSSAVKRVGSLEDNFPDIALEWNYDKNVDLKPSEVTAKSNKKVWWKCSKGHEWQATLKNRTKGSGCPVCKKTRRGTGK